MQFEKITEESLATLDGFFKKQTTRMSVYTTAYQFMWKKDLFTPDYAIVGRCLVLKGSKRGKEYFFYPLSENGDIAEEEKAIEKIEDYCRERDLPLRYINVPEEKVGFLCSRYETGIHIENVRAWQDYLYYAEDFRHFAGGKFAGQRNHVKKFYQRYPSARFVPFQAGDEKKILDFLKEYEKTQFFKSDYYAKWELKMVKKLVPKMTELGIFGGYMQVDGKVVSFAAGERVKDMLVVGVENALRGYDGIYPATAQAFVRAFADDGVVYLNREDDSGDLGLRKSKLQYRPCRMVKKFSLFVDKPLQKAERLPKIRTERLVLKRIPDSDGAAYARLAGDVERNRFWGYDYRESLGRKTADEKFFLRLIRNDWRRRGEMSLGIYESGRLIGEAVLHRFGYRGQAEVGVRLLPEYEGRGYAREAVRAATDYAFIAFGVERMEAKCYKENARSASMLEGAGMRRCGEDETYLYFYRTPAM